MTEEEKWYFHCLCISNSRRCDNIILDNSQRQLIHMSPSPSRRNDAERSLAHTPKSGESARHRAMPAYPSVEQGQGLSETPRTTWLTRPSDLRSASGRASRSCRRDVETPVMPVMPVSRRPRCSVKMERKPQVLVRVERPITGKTAIRKLPSHEDVGARIERCTRTTVRWEPSEQQCDIRLTKLDRKRAA